MVLMVSAITRVDCNRVSYIFSYVFSSIFLLFLFFFSVVEVVCWSFSFETSTFWVVENLVVNNKKTIECFCFRTHRLIVVPWKFVVLTTSI